MLDDVQTRDVAYLRSPDTITPVPPPVHLRRAQPVSILLPRTAAWIAQIPENFRPTSLAREFPRIANVLCANWGDAPSRAQCLEALLTGDRQNRKGFPAPVLRELQRLYSAHLAQSDTNSHNAWKRD